MECILSCYDITSDYVIANIDMKNAFNAVHKKVVLQEIHQRSPEICIISYLSCGLDTPLYYGLAEGDALQQEHPLAPLVSP